MRLKNPLRIFACPEYSPQPSPYTASSKNVRMRQHHLQHDSKALSWTSAPVSHPMTSFCHCLQGRRLKMHFLFAFSQEGNFIVLQRQQLCISIFTSYIAYMSKPDQDIKMYDLFSRQTQETKLNFTESDWWHVSVFPPGLRESPGSGGSL